MIVSCLEKLKRHDDIIDLEREYNSLTYASDKATSTSSFLWAFFLYRENTKIERAIANPGSTKSSKVYYYLVVHMISIKNFEKAHEYLESAFRDLAQEKAKYTAGDQYELQDTLMYAQLFYECSEVLKPKRNKTNTSNLSAIWTHRIKFFKRSEIMWERLIVLRHLVLPIQSNLVFYLQIIAAMRKSGYFNLIDENFTKHFEFHRQET